MQLKFTDSPGFSVPPKAPAPLFLLAAAVQLAHEFVPETTTLWRIDSPVLVSVTVSEIDWPTTT